MKVCQVVASINEEIGGPAQSVSQLSIHLAAVGVSSEVFTLDYQRHGKQVSAEKLALHSFPAHMMSRNFRGLHFGAMQELVKLTSEGFDLIHNHGLWMFPNLFARRAAKMNKIPLVVSPRGMLEEWSMNRSMWKKKFAWLFFERENLRAAKMFHATSKGEMESIRALGFHQPVAVIPNGVSKAERDPSARDLLEEKYPNLKGKKWLLFLSRIDPKKGIDLLIQMWAKLSEDFPHWHLVVAGPDLLGWRGALEKQVSQLSLTKNVTFTGALSGKLKSAAYSGAELFVLPTHSENFGMVVAEALSYGLPVITTTKSPWGVLETNNCGWWVEDSEQCFMEALREAMGLSEPERTQKGINGIEVASTQYSWSSVAAKMSQAYSWLLGDTAKPDFVYE